MPFRFNDPVSASVTAIVSMLRSASTSADNDRRREVSTYTEAAVATAPEKNQCTNCSSGSRSNASAVQYPAAENPITAT